MSIRDHSKWRVRRHHKMAQEVATFLRTEAVKSIRFVFGKTHMYPSSWETLAAALVADDPQLSVRKDRRAVRKVAHAAAYYDQVADTIVFKTFRPLWTAQSQGTAVHECVHAWQDHTPGQIDRFETEGAAELAKYWYHVNVGTPTKSPAAQRMLDFAAQIKARDTSKYGIAVRLNADERAFMKTHVEARWKAYFEEHDFSEYEFDGWTH